MTGARWMFTALLLAATGVLIARSLTLSPAARIAPLWVLLPTAALLGVRLLLDLASGPDGRDRARSPAHRNEPDQETEDFDARVVGGPEWSRETSAGWRGARIGAWIAGLVGLVHLLGLFAALPIYLTSYLRVEADLSWPATIVATVLLVGGLYLVFGVVVDLPLPEGILAGPLRS